MIAALMNRLPRLLNLDHHMKEVVSNASAAFALKVLGAGLQFAFNLLLARLLGAEGAGVYYLALTITGIASVVSRVGLDNALLRFTAAHAAQDDWVKVSGISRESRRIAVTASAVVTACVIGGAPIIAQDLFSEPALVTPLRLMALSILPISLLTLYGELLKGLKKIRDAVLVQNVGVPLMSLMTLVILGNSMQVNSPAIAYVVAVILVLLLAVGLWRRAAPQLVGLPGSFDTRLLMTTSLPLFWVAFLNLVMSSTDTVALGIWTDAKSVGIYGVALRTALLTSFILAAMNSIVAPKFAALYAQGDYRALGDLARNSAQLMTLLTAPVLLLFIGAPTWVLDLFGPGFEAGGPVLVILALGQFINVATGSVGYLLMMSGHEKLMRNNVIGSLALNILLNVILVQRLGMVGAALATSLSVIALNLISTFLVYRKFSILVLPIPRWGR